MREKDFISATNFARLQVALDAIGRTTYMTEGDAELRGVALRAIRRLLDADQERIGKTQEER